MADWNQRGSVLVASDAADSDFFGVSVALSSDGNVLFVGANGWEGANSGQGGLYIFDRSGSSWTQRGSVLTASDAAASDAFGWSVASNSDGTFIVVGAQGWEGAVANTGGVYTFRWNSGTSSWDQLGSVLEVTTSSTSLFFGSGVALSDDNTRLVVGARGSDTGGTDRGAVYTFSWDEGTDTWTQVGATMQAADAANSDFYGRSVALNGDGTILAVGAFRWEGASGTDRGGVYLYDWNSGTSAWDARGSVLEAPDAANSDFFGYSTALNGDGTRLFVGAVLWEGASGTDRGGVYQFDWSGSAWSQTGAVVEAPDAATDDDFGATIATTSDGIAIAVGADTWEGSLTNQGGVYVCDYAPPPTGTGVITIRPAVAGEGEYTNTTGATGTGEVTIRPAVAGSGTYPLLIGAGAITIRPAASGAGRFDYGWYGDLSSAPSRMSAALAVFEISWSSALASAPSVLSAEAWAGTETRGALGLGYSASGIDRSAVAGTTITVSVAGITWPAQRVSIRKILEQGDGESPYGQETAEVAIPYTPAAFAALYAAAQSGETLAISAHYTLDDGAAYTRSLGDFAITGASRPAGAGTVLLSGERATVYAASDDDLELAGVSYETARSIRCAVDHQVFPGQFVVGRAAAFTAGGVTITLDAPSNTASMEVFARG